MLCMPGTVQYSTRRVPGVPGEVFRYVAMTHEWRRGGAGKRRGSKVCAVLVAVGVMAVSALSLVKQIGSW